MHKGITPHGSLNTVKQDEEIAKVPVLKSAQKEDKTVIKIRVPIGLKSDIEAYCQWADIHDLSAFIIEATEFVFSKDKEWKKHNDKEVSLNTQDSK